MTNQEIIEQLKSLKSHCEDFRDDEDCVWSKDVEALEKAIEALEKQISKKPTYEGDGYYDGEIVYDTWICPCCGKDYEVEYDDYKYCPECGQAIDWSDD